MKSKMFESNQGQRNIKGLSKLFCFLFVFAIILGGGLFFSGEARAATYYVNVLSNDACDGTTADVGVSGTCAKKTIPAGIGVTTATGDIVSVATGTYTQTDGNHTMNWNGSIKHITLQCADAPNCIIDGEEADKRAFYFYLRQTTTDDIIDGFTIRRFNSISGDGGGIFLDRCSLTVRNSVFEDNILSSSRVGGGIYFRTYASSGSGPVVNLAVESTTFQRNFAKWGGGITSRDQSAVTDSSLVNVTITDSVFDRNETYSDGGAINIYDDGTLIMSGTTFTGNYTGGDHYGGGGAVYVSGLSSSSTITNSHFGTDSNLTKGHLATVNEPSYPESGSGTTTATFNVDSGHNLEVGDVVVAEQRRWGSMIYRTVQGVTATTITLDQAVTVKDNDYIYDLKGNESEDEGSAIQMINPDGNWIISKSVFMNNIATLEDYDLPLPNPGGKGTVMFYGSGSYKPIIRYSIIGNNFNDSEGGVFFYKVGSNNLEGDLQNTIIVGDSSAGITAEDNNPGSGEVFPNIKNNIVWNSNGTIEIQSSSGVYNFDVTHTAVRDIDYSGTGNINLGTTSPFTDDSNNDFTLLWNSTAIDAGAHIDGVTQSCSGACTDYAGNPIYGTPDIGAYEYQPPYTIGTNEIDTAGDVRIYADGKFRNTATAGGTTADLSITPSGGFGAGDYSEWMNIDIDTWNTTGTYYKKWTETSDNSSLTSAHTVGDLSASTYYTVWYTKSGEDKTRLTTEQADGSSQIAFTYDQGYSDVIFEIEEDETAPAAFELSSPANNSWTNDNTPTLAWNASSDTESGLAKYQLWINDTLDKDDISSSATSTTPTSALTDGSYTWYVKAIDNQGCSFI